MTMQLLAGRAHAQDPLAEGYTLCVLVGALRPDGRPERPTLAPAILGPGLSADLLALSKSALLDIIADILGHADDDTIRAATINAALVRRGDQPLGAPHG